MSNKQFGLRKERVVKQLLYEEGAIFAQRQRGSFGNFDVIGYFEDYCLLVSVKSTKQKYMSYKKEIKKIENVEIPSYCKKQLRIWWSPRKDRIKKGWEVINVKSIEESKEIDKEHRETWELC